MGKNNYYKRKELVLLIVVPFLFLFLIGGLYAAPTKFSGTSTLGIDIEHPLSSTMQQNISHKFHFHLFNASTGIPIKADGKTVNCTFHLYDALGNHILKVNDKVLSDDIYDYEQIVTGQNLSVAGEYSYVFQCNSSVSGGYYANTFQVTPSGRAGGTDANNFVWLFILLTWGVAFVGFFGKNVWISVIGGMGMMVFGIYALAQGIMIYENWITQVISYFSIGLGAFFSIYSLIDYINEGD